MVDVLTGQDQAGGRPYAKYRGAGTRKVKPIWILLKQETVSGSDMTSASDRYPRHHPTTQFLQAGACHDTTGMWLIRLCVLILRSRAEVESESHQFQRNQRHSNCHQIRRHH